MGGKIKMEQEAKTYGKCHYYYEQQGIFGYEAKCVKGYIKGELNNISFKNIKYNGCKLRKEHKK